MPSTEQKFFLSVLADHLNGRVTSPVPELDWGMVYDAAVRHQVSALVYAQCGAFMPPEAELRFLQDFGAAVASHAARRQIASDLDRIFTHHKIPYVLVKGIMVAESYPQPELRTMGDIDVIVNAEDKERAHELLLELGFHNTQKTDCEWSYDKDSCKIELHHRLLYEEVSNAPSALHLADRLREFSHPVPGSCRRELSPEFHFLFLLMHLKKHLVFHGAGFRQFMDLAVTAQKWPIDWSQTEKWLSETGLLSFFEQGMALCRKWFDLELPFTAKILTPEFAEEAAQQIFRNGVFGFDDEANAENYLITWMDADGGDRLSQRLRICWQELLVHPAGENFLAVLFPEYETLRNTKPYSFVNQRPWLVPVAWIYRFVHSIWFKILHTCRIMTFSRQKILERRENLKKLGL